jgi:hydroxymethylbilane synthase
MILIGSRGSALALWQARHVEALLAGRGHDVRIQTITTTGDRSLEGRLQAIGGKGAFLKEIEEALLAEKVDLAVHSLKDVPTAVADGLTLCAILPRADPRDALISAAGRSLQELPAGSRVGTTSLRRKAQLLARRPDLVVQDLRGNVDTRLRSLGEGRYEAIVLALAGLVRLGRDGEATEVLAPEVMLPAPGQGAIALQCREGDRSIHEVVAAFHDAPTARAVAAERSLLEALDAGCNVPLGALAVETPGGLRLAALVAREDGSEVLRHEAVGADPGALGRDVAGALLARGAAALLAAQPSS